MTVLKHIKTIKYINILKQSTNTKDFLASVKNRFKYNYVIKILSNTELIAIHKALYHDC